MWSQEITNKSKVNGKLINGTLGQSEQKELVSETYLTSTTSIETEINGWRRGVDDIKVMFKSVSDNRSLYYNIFFDGWTYYWIASRATSDFSITPTRLSFGLFQIYTDRANGNITVTELFSASGSNRMPSYNYYVRPIVTIPANILNVTEGDGTIDTPWGIQ